MGGPIDTNAKGGEGLIFKRQFLEWNCSSPWNLSFVIYLIEVWVWGNLISRDLIWYEWILLFAMFTFSVLSSEFTFKVTWFALRFCESWLCLGTVLRPLRIVCAIRIWTNVWVANRNVVLFLTNVHLLVFFPVFHGMVEIHAINDLSIRISLRAWISETTEHLLLGWLYLHNVQHIRFFLNLWFWVLICKAEPETRELFSWDWLI